MNFCRIKVSLGSSEPYYITPFIKSLLKQRNRLRRRGRLEEADELATKINEKITELQQNRFCKLTTASPAELWKSVKNSRCPKNTEPSHADALLSDVNAVNKYFAKISTKPVGSCETVSVSVSGLRARSISRTSADRPTSTDTCDSSILETTAIRQIVNVCDDTASHDDIPAYVIELLLRHMRKTSPGYDKVPAWFFKSCSYEVADIVAYIINETISSAVTGTVPKPKPRFLCKNRTETDRLHKRPNRHSTSLHVCIIYCHTTRENTCM